MIRAHGLRFGFGAARGEVLRGVDLFVARGEFVALFGPNGAGKSTLLRILAGELPRFTGAVELEGRPIRGYARRELARTVATVPQETLATFGYTVGELTLMGRAPHLGRFALEGEADVAAARRALEALELWELRDRPIGEVSGGERQRAAIARALAQEAPILLLDEPTAFLDVRHQVGVYRLLRDLQRSRGLTVLAVSHDVNLAAQYAARVALLKDGTVRAQGPPDEALKPDTLREVFESEVDVARHPRTGRPILLFGGD